MSKQKLINKYTQEIEKLEEQKLEWFGEDIMPLHYLSQWDSNRLCYLNGRLETFKKIVKELSKLDTE